VLLLLLLLLFQRLLGYRTVASIMYGRQHHPGRPVSPADDDYDYYDSPDVAAAQEGRARPLSKAEAGLSAGIARLLMKLLDNLEMKVCPVSRGEGGGVVGEEGVRGWPEPARSRCC
jgi:hypothetical protein